MPTRLASILKIWRQNPYFASFIVFILVAPLLVFTVATPVATGTKLLCRYNHTISDNTRTVLAWRWRARDYKVTVKTSVCEKHRRLEALLRQARDAKNHGDDARAQKLIKQIKSADPLFRPLELAAIGAGTGAAGAGSSSNPSSPGTTPGTTPSPGQKPVYSGDLTGLFPVELPGYKQVSDAPGQLSASRLYQADQKAHPKVDLLTIQFSRAGSADSAQTYINLNVKNYYAAHARTTQIKGQTAYFGTDGGDLAVLAYPVGGVLVELEMSAAGGPAENLYNDLVELSKIVP